MAGIDTGHGPVWWAGLTALGLVVGIIAGMFGVGGGFLMTPLLALLFRVPLPIAVGTGLCQMIGVATSAFLRHRKLGQGEITIDYLMLVGSVLGVGLGAQTVGYLDGKGSVAWHGHSVAWAKLILSMGYIVLLSGITVWMARDSKRPGFAAQRPRQTRPLNARDFPALCAFATFGAQDFGPAGRVSRLADGFLVRPFGNWRRGRLDADFTVRGRDARPHGSGNGHFGFACDLAFWNYRSREGRKRAFGDGFDAPCRFRRWCANRRDVDGEPERAKAARFFRVFGAFNGCRCRVGFAARAGVEKGELPLPGPSPKRRGESEIANLVSSAARNLATVSLETPLSSTRLPSPLRGGAGGGVIYRQGPISSA